MISGGVYNTNYENGFSSLCSCDLLAGSEALMENAIHLWPDNHQLAGLVW